MAGLQELKEIYDKKGEGFIKNLLNNKVIISENLDGSKFSVQSNSEELSFYKRDDRYPINIIDRTFVIYYEKAINYCNSIKSAFLTAPTNWRFCFQYFVTPSPINITYDELPKNNLVLTHILVKSKGGKTIEILDDTVLLRDWATTLDVAGPPIVYAGVLKDTQKKKLLDYLESNEADLTEIFGTDSFIKYIIKILNPSLKKTLLNSDLTKPIDSIVFKFTNKGDNKIENFSAKIVDPLFKKFNTLSFKTPRFTSDTYSIVLFDIIEFIERNPTAISGEILSKDSEHRYLELICDLFNKYIEYNNDKFKDFDFDSPDFSKNKFFRVNIELIKNKKTLEYIESSDIYQNILKVFISSFRKKRKKTTDILSINIIKILNGIINKIKNITETPISGNFKTYEQYILLKECNELIYTEEEYHIADDIKSEDRPIVVIKETIEPFFGLPDQGEKKVNIVVGRFQPFTKGHMKVLEELYMQNSLPIVIVPTTRAKRDLIKNPFGKELQTKLFNSLKEHYDFLEEIVHIEGSVSLSNLCKVLRPTYEPVLWGMGEDRKETFQNQVNLYSKELNMLEDFQIHSIDRDEISSTEVRRYLDEDNEEGYMKMVPEALHDYYSALQFMINFNKKITLDNGEK